MHTCIHTYIYTYIHTHTHHSSKGNKGILPHPRHLLHGHLLREFCQDVLKASSLACHSITHPASQVRRQASGKLAPPDPIDLYSSSSQVISISIYLSIDHARARASTHTHTHTQTHTNTHTQLIRKLVVAGALCLSEHLCDRPVCCDTVVAGTSSSKVSAHTVSSHIYRTF